MKKQQLLITLFLLLLLMLTPWNVRAQSITVPQLISDGMVLQRKAATPLWGKAPANTKVKIECSWAAQIYETTADAFGKWLVKVNTPDATPESYGPYTIKISGLNEILISDVLIGEVWLCSGQSNMAHRVFESWNDSWSVQWDHIPEVRIFDVKYGYNSVLQEDVAPGSKWCYGFVGNDVNNPEHIMVRLSAVAYYYARKLNEVLKIPVGILATSVGGTNAEEWCKPSITHDNPEIVLAPSRTPGGLYHAMLKPLAPYKLAGFVWYQGENNVGTQEAYQKLSTLQIANWREDFQDSYLPFYLVQLPLFSADWRTFREIQQSIVESVPNTGMAVTYDVGEEGDIHHHNKKPVGERLATMALARVYGCTDYAPSSPLFREVRREGRNLRVCFNYADQGLVLKEGAGLEPALFEVAGEDQIYYHATANIEGNTVLLSSKNVFAPLYARYCWYVVGQMNLYTSDGLPVAPFRSLKQR